MPTRKELLEQLRDNVAGLSSEVHGGAVDLRATAEALRDQASAAQSGWREEVRVPLEVNSACIAVCGKKRLGDMSW